MAGSGTVSSDKVRQERSEAVFEHQTCLPDVTSGRPRTSETWEWTFQDSFQKPFLDANAILVDRVAIDQLIGAGAVGSAFGDGSSYAAINALRHLADYMIEILYASSGHSTIGYELHARVQDNPHRLGCRQRQQPQHSRVGTAQGALPIRTGGGFIDLEEENEDRAGPHGFRLRYRTPPSPYQVANQLAYNVMNALADAWR